MNQTVPTKIKARDIAIGFFGWFILDNIFFVLILILGTRYPKILGDVDYSEILSLVILWLPTVIACLVLFITKRNWIGAGVVSAVVINAGILLIPRFLILGFPDTLPSFLAELRIMGYPWPIVSFLWQ